MILNKFHFHFEIYNNFGSSRSLPHCNDLTHKCWPDILNSMILALYMNRNIIYFILLYLIFLNSLPKSLNGNNPNEATPHIN